MIASESGAAAPIPTEIAIVGGGMVGLTLALALDQAGIAVTVLDAAPPATQLDARFGGRASAIAFASFRMWKTLGVVERLAGDFQRIENILVTDGRIADGLRGGGPSALRLHFDRRELDDAPEGEALGYMVENRASRRALMAEVATRPGITMMAPAHVTGTVVTDHGVELALASGARIDASLAISAEGKASSFTNRYKYDGKEYPYKTSTSDGMISLKRIDDFHTDATIKGRKTHITSKAVISKDGKTRTLTSTVANAEGKPTNNVAVYDKQ